VGILATLRELDLCPCEFGFGGPEFKLTVLMQYIMVLGILHGFRFLIDYNGSANLPKKMEGLNMSLLVDIKIP
jgi:hypothetical protein